MKRALVASVAAVTLAGGGVTAVARAGNPAATTACPASVLCAGVGVEDATWHVGAGAGQYASSSYDNPTDVSQEWDPSVEHVTQQSSYGVASRLSIRAIVVRDGKGDPPVALVKDDNYLAQDMLTRRVGQILAADGSAVTYDHILMSATHDHNSPYYSTPAAGVWLFQDAMDLRMFEYQALQMAHAIEAAERSMAPARVGGTTVQFPDFQGNIAGSDRNEDGSPTGYPAWDNDHGLVVLRFDNVSDPANPKPLATYINYAEHGESLDGYNLISADWLAPFQRFVDRATGVPMVFSQGSVGSAEGPYDYANPKKGSDGGDTFPEIWGHEGYAQAERGTHLMAERVVAAWNAIGSNDSSVQAPYDADTSNPTVTMLTHWVAGPVSHPYPSVGNCRSAPSDGDPGVPAAGLPDCERYSSANNDFFGNNLPGLFSTGLWNQLKSAGIPLPDNYDASSFGSVEENLRIKLQAVRIGDILLASCSCEAQADLIRNLESRTDNVPGNQYNGFDYNNQADVNEGWPADTVGHHVDACYAVDTDTYSCPDPRDRWGNNRVTMSKAAFDHMEYEINNDAAGWNDPSYAAQAGSEPADSSQIKGNFTHNELGVTNADGAYGSCPGYALSIGLGHTGDYDGYTVSYREYMARDAYRKALTSYGPHTADYMVTNLVGMAANLQCGTPLIAQPTDPIAIADEQRQNAEATVLGQISSAYYYAWAQQLPDNAGPARALAQPWDVQRFDVTQFRWVGGDNYTDQPTVTVQRLVDGKWQTYADQSGEVQVFLDQPQDMIDALPAYRSGTQQWNWRASFEVFDSYPRADVPGGQVPDGTYHFVVDGDIHTAGVATPYHLTSEPFTVSPWTGITVRDPQRTGSQVSFVIDPIAYPSTPPAAHRAGILWYTDPRSKGNHGPVCERCSFRPWATSGHVAGAVVQVDHGNGRIEQVPASYDATTGRWVADVPPGVGLTVSVPAGGVLDTYGETNGQSLAF
jgi:hypothetical protein